MYFALGRHENVREGGQWWWGEGIIARGAEKQHGGVARMSAYELTTKEDSAVCQFRVLRLA
jgi:hypothetical protein